MSTIHNEVLKGQEFQAKFTSLVDGQRTWHGTFLEVADATLAHHKDYFSHQPRWAKQIAKFGFSDKLELELHDNKTGELTDIPTPLSPGELLTAIKAYADEENGSQLWLMIKTELIKEQDGFDITGMMQRIESL